MRQLAILALIVAGFAFTAYPGIAIAEKDTKDTEAKKVQTCPIMKGNKVVKDLYVDYKGFRVYFCCPPCVKSFKADPEKHLQYLLDEKFELEKAPEKAQTVCPITGNKVDNKVFTDHKGYRIYFCSEGSKEKFLKDADKNLVKLLLTGVTPEKAPAKKQDICPVTKEKINRDIYVDHKGFRVFFCCEACKKAFEKDKDKMLKEIQDSGIALEKTPEAKKEDKKDVEDKKDDKGKKDKGIHKDGVCPIDGPCG